MADRGDAAKGVGFLAILSLFSVRMCHSCENEAKAGLHDSHGFFSSCNKVERGRGDEFHPHNAPDEVTPLSDVHPNTEILPTDPPKADVPPLSEEGSTILRKNADGVFPLHDIQIDRNKPVIVEGKLNEEDIKELNSRGVTFVINKEVYEEQKNTKAFKLVVVFSEDKDKLKQLYGIDDKQADEVIRFASDIINDPSIIKVDNEADFATVVKEQRSQGISPVVIFHNSNNTIFDNSLESYGIKNVITCNSYALSQNTFQISTDFLGIEYVMKSISKCSKDDLFTMYTDFANHYSNLIVADKRKTVTIVVGATTGVTGGGVAIYYSTRNG